MLKRIVGRHLPVEMALLGVIELMLSFSIVYAMLDVRAEFLRRPLQIPAFNPSTAPLAAGLAAIIACCAVVIGLYRPEICLDRRRIVLNAATVAVVAFPVAFLLGGHFGARFSITYAIWLIKVLVIWLGVVVVSRSLFSFVLHGKLFARRILVVGDPARAAQITDLLDSGRAELFEPIEPLDPQHLTPEVLRKHRVWAVVVAAATAGDDDTIDTEEQQRLLDCKLRGIRVYDDATFSEHHLGRISLERIDADWFLRADGFARGLLSRVIKRAVDIVASLLLLILTFPLTLAVAILIRLDSPGASLYRQQRVGLHGKPFTLLKFRSMRSDAEAEGRPR
ncbi:MAG: sugar transferase, partial [Acetobacteraceae bacterium]